MQLLFAIIVFWAASGLEACLCERVSLILIPKTDFSACKTAVGHVTNRSVTILDYSEQSLITLAINATPGNTVIAPFLSTNKCRRLQSLNVRCPSSQPFGSLANSIATFITRVGKWDQVAVLASVEEDNANLVTQTLTQLSKNSIRVSWLQGAINGRITDDQLTSLKNHDLRIIVVLFSDFEQVVDFLIRAGKFGISGSRYVFIAAITGLIDEPMSHSDLLLNELLQSVYWFPTSSTSANFVFDTFFKDRNYPWRRQCLDAVANLSSQPPPQLVTVYRWSSELDRFQKQVDILKNETFIIAAAQGLWNNDVNLPPQSFPKTVNGYYLSELFDWLVFVLMIAYYVCLVIVVIAFLTDPSTKSRVNKFSDLILSGGFAVMEVYTMSNYLITQPVSTGYNHACMAKYIALSAGLGAVDAILLGRMVKCFLLSRKFRNEIKTKSFPRNAGNKEVVQKYLSELKIDPWWLPLSGICYAVINVASLAWWFTNDPLDRIRTSYLVIYDPISDNYIDYGVERCTSENLIYFVVLHLALLGMPLNCIVLLSYKLRKNELVLKSPHIKAICLFGLVGAWEFVAVLAAFFLTINSPGQDEVLAFFGNIVIASATFVSMWHHVRSFLANRRKTRPMDTKASARIFGEHSLQMIAGMAMGRSSASLPRPQTLAC